MLERINCDGIRLQVEVWVIFEKSYWKVKIVISSLNKGVLLGNEGFVLLLKEIFYDQFCTF